MTGMITPSMPVFAVENRAHGNRAHATINEGLGKVLRFGANDDSVLARLRWLAVEAGPLLGAALRAARGIDLRALMAQALRMGDEMHQRNVAASSLLARIAHAARGPRGRQARSRGAARRVHRRQRPVLPQRGHGGGQGHGRSRQWRAGLARW